MVMKQHLYSHASVEKKPFLAPGASGVVTGTFVVASQVLMVQTAMAPYFVDITEPVQALVEQSEVLAGTVLVFSRHTTAAIVANEHEPLLLQDLTEVLARLIPKELSYKHDDFTIRTVNLTTNERENGHAHCQQLFLGPSMQFPILAGYLDLGQWQRIFLVELDAPRSRQVVLQVSGIRSPAH